VHVDPNLFTSSAHAAFDDIANAEITAKLV